ncbi:hypothetical protein ACH5RR_016655 [Cinchona calisaya]|uniref:Uncharacterized protein n=1 Tax=Cinchona calisaya TaxID=153742 RepID=A0ABD2ZWK3_9GENT
MVEEPIIFSTTIIENIIYARHDSCEAEMIEAARTANAHHFISSLPHGYDTHVWNERCRSDQGKDKELQLLGLYKRIHQYCYWTRQARSLNLSRAEWCWRF